MNTDPPTVPAVWFPAIRAGTGVDVFTMRLVDALNGHGIRAEIAWLPHRAEYLPWSVPVPKPPAWANIVHVNTWLHRRFIPAHLSVVATMHLCVHDPALSPYKSRAQALYHRHWVRPLEEYMLMRAQSVTAVSHYTAEQTMRAFDINDVRVIHNGVPVPEMGDMVGRKPHKPFRLLYVGNWSSRKGTDLLAPIMERLGDGFQLLYTADARRAHVNAQLPSNCQCVGRIGASEMPQIYASADALVFPTRMEGFGLAAAEAMMHGLPVVASRSSSLPEVVEHGVTGLLCGQDNVDAFADAIRRLAAGTEMWDGMVKAAATRARDIFSLDVMVNSYAEAYRLSLFDSGS